MKIVKGKIIYSVQEVNSIAKEILEQAYLWIEGEITSFQENPAWFNSFLNLSGGNNILECFVRPSNLQNIEPPFEGKKVIAYGRLTLFKKNQYKMELFSIKEAGEGILQKKFEELYKKMKSEGLFDKRHKKEIPLYPRRICIVTSKGSAGWNDFKTHTVDKKIPIEEFCSADVRVEGPRAVIDLLEMLPKVDQSGFDVIVITRGGGASESLLEVFNNEDVTRAIFNMKTPKIVAIGHETNISFSELVADKRASTPTDAANMVISGYLAILDKLSHYKFVFKLDLQRFFSENAQTLDSFYFRLNQIGRTFKDLPHRLATARESLKRHEKHLIVDRSGKVEDLMRQIQKELIFQINNKTDKLRNLGKSLTILSPENTLNRGYSITTDKKGKVIKSTKYVVVGELIGVKLAQGNLKSRITSKE